MIILTSSNIVNPNENTSVFGKWSKFSAKISDAKYLQSPSSTLGLVIDVTWPRSPRKKFG